MKVEFETISKNFSRRLSKLNVQQTSSGPLKKLYEVVLHGQGV